MEERVTELETKVAYQDELLEQLNQVIIEQQATIDKMQKDFSKLNDTVKNFGDPRIAEKDEDPPPHY